MHDRALLLAAVLIAALTGCASPYYGPGTGGGGPYVFGGRPSYGGYGNADFYGRARYACENEAAEHDFRIGRFGQEERLGDGRYAIPVELQRDRRLYSGTCVFDAEQREARLRNIEEARTVGGGGQFANYADPRRVCAEMAENRGWAVERIGNAQEIGYSRYLVRLRVRNPGHANNSDVIDCTWDARDGRVQLTRS